MTARRIPHLKNSLVESRGLGLRSVLEPASGSQPTGTSQRFSTDKLAVHVGGGSDPDLGVGLRFRCRLSLALAWFESFAKDRLRVLVSNSQMHCFTQLLDDVFKVDADGGFRSGFGTGVGIAGHAPSVAARDKEKNLVSLSPQPRRFGHSVEHQGPETYLFRRMGLVHVLVFSPKSDG